MTAPLIAMEFAAILVTAGCLNLTTVSFVHRLGARRKPSAVLGTDDNGDWDELLQAAEALSAQYDAIVARPAGGLSKRDQDRRAGRTSQPVGERDASVGTEA